MGILLREWTMFMRMSWGKFQEALTVNTPTVIDRPLGKGRIIWSPLPVELNDRIEPITKLYQYALEAAGCKNDLEWIRGGNLSGVYGRKLSFQAGSLFVFVSEFAVDSSIEIKDVHTGFTYSFMLQEERSVLFATDAKGHIKAVYRPEEVEIHVIENRV